MARDLISLRLMENIRSSTDRFPAAGARRVLPPFLVGAAILFAVTYRFATNAIAANDGYLAYCLDDAYIHMAMAKTLATTGTWGLTPDGFTSSSSSPLYLIVLASVYALFGVSDATPLVVNLVAATGSLALLALLLDRWGVRRRVSVVVVPAVVILSPMPTLVLSGMEHCLQILLVLAVGGAAVAAARVPAGQPLPRGLALSLPVAAAALVLTRYEGLFLVLPVCLVLAACRRWGTAVAVGSAAVIPIVVFGLISISKGWYFFPNSLILKGRTPVVNSFWNLVDLLGGGALSSANWVPHILSVFCLSLWVVASGVRTGALLRTSGGMLAMITLGATMLHIQYGSTGAFFRYEAYIVTLGIVIGGLALDDLLSRVPDERVRWHNLPKLLAVAVMVFALVVPVVKRTATAAKQTPLASQNIFDQQVQMGRFLRDHYAGKTVGVNDIGAVSYFGGIHLVDLWGLADMEIARATRENRLDTTVYRRVAAERGMDIAIIYTMWLRQNIPREWTLVGEWTISQNVVCGDWTVAFFAVKPSEIGPLRESLRSFAPALPRDVLQSGLYCEEGKSVTDAAAAVSAGSKGDAGAPL